jgi:small subunit ribosomal protein S11
VPCVGIFKVHDLGVELSSMIALTRHLATQRTAIRPGCHVALYSDVYTTKKLVQELKTSKEKPLPQYGLHVFSSRNNTIATFARESGDVIAWFSGGSCGFKKSHRSSYEAGYQVAVRMFKRVEMELGKTSAQIHLYLNGFGQGRDAVQKALLTSEGDGIRSFIATVTDKTPLKIGGTRSKKTRRL